MVVDHAMLFLVRAERAADRPLSPAVVATVRRSAQVTGDPAWFALAARWTQPVLNPGERWADLALADVAEAGPAWHVLLTHAATVRTSTPTAKWKRAARDMITGLGEERVRRRVLSWLSAVDAGRSLSPAVVGTGRWARAEDQLDPFNAHAVRGLIWLLSCTRSHEDTVATLGGLVTTCLQQVTGRGPRNARVADTTVRALADLGDRSPQDELRRLAGRTRNRVTLRLIRNALADVGRPFAEGVAETPAPAPERRVSPKLSYGRHG